MPPDTDSDDGLPSAVRRMIRDTARRVMGRGGTWPSTRLWWPVTVELGDRAPDPDVLDAVLADDPWLWCLPDGDWLHVGAATWGRLFTTRLGSVAGTTGIVRTVPDLSAALHAFRGWDRVPVRSRRCRGLAELVQPAPVVGASDGVDGTRLVLPPGLLPGGATLLAVSPGPEGLRVLGVEDDPVATECLRLRLRLRADRARRLRGAPSGGTSALAWSPGSVPPPRRPWTVLDVELAVLARDPSLRRSATVPVREILGAAAPPLADTA